MEDERSVQQEPQRSLSDRMWQGPAASPGEGAVRTLRNTLNVSTAFARLLVSRGLSDPDDAWSYLHPEECEQHPASLMLGMSEAVRRIIQAIEGYEKIVVFGDYDVDGTSAAGIFYGYLKRLGARVQYFIPNRMEDGYGFSAPAIRKFADWKADLVITCDHGSTDLEAPGELRKLGIDLIITDHHQLGCRKPDALALVNPQQPGCPYPFKPLAAAGVAYKVIQALDDQLTEQNFWNLHGLCHTSPDYYLDLVALATVADMAPLIGENRLLVRLGLKALNERQRPGLSGLVKECRIRGPITPGTISFKLAPKINALGRVGDPRLGMQLLMSRSFTEARRLARQLLAVNRERQAIERGVYADASQQVESMPDDAALVLAGEGWHPGVIGSIATRIAFQSRRPTVVLTQQAAPSMFGSARSSENYDVLGVLESCQDLLQRFGGHRSAAGLMLHQTNLNAFVRFFQNAAERDSADCNGKLGDCVQIETWIDPEGLTSQFLEELALMSPFGHGNPEPVVGVRGFVLRDPAVYNQRHLRFSLNCDQSGDVVEAFAWDHSDWNVEATGRYDIAFMPQFSPGAGTLRPQIRVLDLMQARSTA